MTEVAGNEPAGNDPAAPEAGWDLGYLRVGALITAAGAVVAVPIVGLVAGARQAWGVVLGLTVVVAFFALSGIVVAWAGRIHYSWTLPAALITFGIKALVLFAVVLTLPDDGPIEPGAFGWAVVAGVLGWQVIHSRWVLTRKLLYVDPGRAQPQHD